MTSYLKKYACLYGRQDFTDEEQAEIGRFAANLMKVASEGNEQAIVRLFRSEFGGMDNETFDYVDRYLEFLTLYDDGASMSKTARVPVESVLAALALGLAAVDPVERIVGKISTNYALKNSLRQILQNHPELRNNPHTPEYFQAVADFAPIIAKNPLVAGNIMMQIHRVGPSYVTPQLIETLIGVQDKAKPGGPGLSAMSEPVGEFAKAMRGHKEMMAGERGEGYGEARFWSDRT